MNAESYDTDVGFDIEIAYGERLMYDSCYRLFTQGRIYSTIKV